MKATLVSKRDGSRSSEESKSGLLSWIIWDLHNDVLWSRDSKKDTPSNKH